MTNPVVYQLSLDDLADDLDPKLFESLQRDPQALSRFMDTFGDALTAEAREIAATM